MSDIAITVENLGKMYRIGALQQRPQTLRELVKCAAASPLQYLTSRIRRASEAETLWALRNVSFEIKKGEAVGIIGRNGAGKSTLLKILSRITDPTEGRAVLRGRVNSLLEVGTGFHPELTGRENIYLSAAINGMRKAEIDRKFDEIVAFSEIEKFIDTPVKRYSSGMYVRLAFAVAANLEPEILVLDEVLAVGDATFQKKCLGKMSEVSQQGRTVLFVSHNLVAVTSLCRQAMLLDSGHIMLQGDVSSVIAAYLRSGLSKDQNAEWPNPESAPGTEDLRIAKVVVAADDNTRDGILRMQSAVRIETDYWIQRNDVPLHLTYHLLNDQGIVVLTTSSGTAKGPAGYYHASVVIPANLLNSGGYSLNLLIVKNENRVVFMRESIASFSMVDTAQRDYAYMGREPGVVRIPFKWVVTPR